MVLGKKCYFVYILTNFTHTVLYVGITSDLLGRSWEHKIKEIKGFAEKYNVDILVWYEIHDDVQQAIYREKTIKRWKREWKEKLIEEMNPRWRDLYGELI